MTASLIKPGDKVTIIEGEKRSDKGKTGTLVRWTEAPRIAVVYVPGEYSSKFCTTIRKVAA